jgi:tetratricopeptide (TPR) repeat protein
MTSARARLSILPAVLSLLLASDAFAQRRPAARVRRPAVARGLTEVQWADSVRRAIDAATRAGGVARLEGARQVVARALAAYPDDGLLLHYEGFLLYRIITVAGPALTPQVTGAYLDDARVALERSIARRPMAESYLIVSEIYSRQIAADPSRGPSLAPNMALARARAMAIGAKNPRVYLLAGIAALYTGPEAGGGLDAAEQLLRASVDLFAKERPRPPDPAWGQAEAYAWLGQVYERTARKPAAAAVYAKALAIEPDNAWVRDVLLPGVR